MSKLLCVYEMKTILLSLKNFEKVKKVEKDLDKYAIRLSNDIFKLKQIARELELIVVAVYKSTASNLLKDLMSIENQYNMFDINSGFELKDINDVITTIINNTNIEALKEIGSYDISSKYYHLYDSIKRERSIPESILEDFEYELSKANNNREDKYNILQNYAGPGYDSITIKNVFKDNCDLYGIESVANKASAARSLKTFKKIIIGANLGARISNDVFDVLILNSIITKEVDLNTMGLLKERKESKAIKNSIKYLRPDGIVLFRLPYFRLTKEINLFISKQFKDVKVVKEYGDSCYINIFGYKHYTKEAKQDIYSYLNQIPNTFNSLTKHISELNELPKTSLPIQYFRGAIMDNEELIGVVNSTNLYNSFIDSHNKVSDQKDIQPLLPFNIGQIGLVLTSGCLDGVIEEYDGQYHVVKGKVLKIRTITTESNNENDDVKTIETFSNKVQINVFTPDGTYIELT